MKVYIHPSATGETRDKLVALLEEAGCQIVDAPEELDVADAGDEEMPVATGDEVEQDDIGEEGEEPETAPAVPACVVVLQPGLVESDLEPDLARAVKHGCRVIGVWRPGAAADPSPLGDYGADTVPWDSARVRDAICGVPQHQGPTGERAPKPKATHGGC